MDCSTTQSNPLESYYKATHLFNTWPVITECLNSVLYIISSIGLIISTAFRSKGKESPLYAKKIEEKANTAIWMIYFARIFESFESLITLKWLFKPNSDTGIYSTKEFNHPIAIVSGLTSAAEAALYFVTQLEELFVVNLGRHATNIGLAGIALYAAATTFNFIDSIRCFVEASAATVRDEAVNLLQSFAYLISLPFDCGIGMSVNAAPALSIFGAVIYLIGSLIIIATNIWQFHSINIDTKP